MLNNDILRSLRYSLDIADREVAAIAGLAGLALDEAEVAALLVAAGADVDRAGGVSRATPLHEAARRGNVATARALLAEGASLRVRDARGRTPRDRAVLLRKPNVVALFDAVSSQGTTATSPPDRE